MANKGWTRENKILEGDQTWDDINHLGPPPVEDGLYEVLIVETEAASSEKQNSMVKLQLRLDSRFQGESLKVPGRAYDQITIMAKTAFKIKQAALACEVDPPESDSYEQTCKFAEDLLDKKCVVRIENEPNPKTGRNRPIVRHYYSFSTAAEIAAEGSKTEEDSKIKPGRGKKR